MNLAQARTHSQDMGKTTLIVVGPHKKPLSCLLACFIQRMCQDMGRLQNDAYVVVPQKKTFCLLFCLLKKPVSGLQEPFSFETLHYIMSS